MENLLGKVALVTGASRYRGLGRAIALRLALDGASLVVTGRARAKEDRPINEKEMNWTGVRSLADEIKENGGNALAVEGDVTQESDVKAIVKSASEVFGKLDIIVNNAGVPSGAGAAPILDMDNEL